MQEPELSSAVELVVQLAAREFGVKLARGEVEHFLRTVLFEPKHLWGAMEDGLITRHETATGVAARVHTWLMDRSGRSWAQRGAHDWEDDFINAMEEALFSQK